MILFREVCQALRCAVVVDRKLRDSIGRYIRECQRGDALLFPRPRIFRDFVETCRFGIERVVRSPIGDVQDANVDELRDKTARADNLIRRVRDNYGTPRSRGQVTGTEEPGMGRPVSFSTRRL